ncbi:S26 family signal peptidase [Lederbergia panacisoli]|uniref:S26 family signal peptidase n=1 Tax=Lederbergia panacisoli TaxID=1255251 RepID=UPI00214C993C|nr:S26 family signal peptidase [Lederbergia panacisoli]MCR2821644.1 S26 family signal peptidase [Lederbergia panacisoli]
MAEFEQLKILKQPLPSLTERKKAEIIQAIRKKSTNKKRLFYLPLIGMCLAFTILAIFLIPLLSEVKHVKNATIIDRSTPRYLPFIESLHGDQYVIQYIYDDMEEWQWEHRLIDKDLIVEPNYKIINRGDIVYFKPTKVMIESAVQLSEFGVSRIVALPGETISISKGQIMIDGKKLETYYGRLRDRGKVVENSKENIDLDPVNLGANEYYILADTWWRGHRLENGKITKEDITGKIIGIRE